MPIRITIAPGSADARIVTFADDRALVTVGRHPSCDVVFPADLTQVSRYHLGFERKLARYRLVMQADNPVFVDGEEAFEGDELPAAALITLGHADGPTLAVEAIEDDGLAPTERYARHASAARVAETAGRETRLMRRLLMGLALAVLALAWTFGSLYLKDRREIADVVAEAYRRQPGAEAENQLARHLRQAAASVYLVAARDEFGITPFGTAWVAGPGVLATNAHVAESFAEMKGKLHMVLRGPGEGADLPIARVELHPHYRPFAKAWTAYGPMAAGAGGETRQITEAGGYDVALMFVAPEHAARLGPPLSIAPDSDLAALEPGNVAGYVGFPIESAALGGVNIAEPEAQVQIGRLTALTDFFLVKSDAADRHLLQHNLPVQGGVSGSPVLDGRGQVIGILSGGNLIEIDENGTRVPSGIGVNFAQRADLLRELLAGEAKQRTETRQAYWQRRLKRYQTEVDVALQDWASGRGASSVPLPVAQVDGRIQGKGRLDMPAFVTAFTAERAGWYLFLATARERENIDMMLVQTTPKGRKIVGMDASPDHYPGIEYGAEAGTELEIVVPGPIGADVRLRVFHLPKEGR